MAKSKPAALSALKLDSQTISDKVMVQKGVSMPTTREEVLRTAMKLSESDRLLLAAELMETVSEDFPGWSADNPELFSELEARANDGFPGIAWEAVKSQLRQDLQP